MNKPKRLYDAVITVRVPSGLVKRARKVAAGQGWTLSEFLRNELRKLAEQDNK